MKKKLLGAVILLTFLAAGCSIPGFTGKLYVCDETWTQGLYELKILGASENSANGNNIYSSPIETVTWDGRTWKVYSISFGRSDVYMEFTSPLGSGFNNERQAVYVPDGGWAAIWFTDSLVSPHDDTFVWESTGDFQLDDCPFYAF